MHIINIFRYLKIFICLLYISNTYAQDKDFAIKIIKELTSEKYAGRGYQKNGVRKAATYIKNKLKQSQIPIIYKQNLSYPVSYISKIKYLQFDSIKAIPGIDYIIYPSSCSIKGTFSIEKITKDSLGNLVLKNYKNKFILFDTSLTENSKYNLDLKLLMQNNPLNCKGFILCKSKNLMQVQRSKTNTWVSMEADIKFLNAKEIKLNLKSKYKPYYKTSNIIGIIPGESDTIIAFSAHYDHMGMLNNIHFPGANDNASGVSMVLDIGKELAKKMNKYTIALLFFTGEEIGLLGSSFFADNPTFDLNKIKYLFNLDVIGSGENGITIVNGTEFADVVALLNKINENNNLQLEIKTRGVSNNSDHAPFYEKGVKAVFIYSMGKAGGYHHPSDLLENLSLAKYNEIVKLLLNTVNY